VTALLLVGLSVATTAGCKMAAKGKNVEGARLHQQGDYAAAVGEFQQALNSDPNNADACYNLAATHHQMGKVYNDPALLAQAESLYHQCLDIDTDHSDCRRGLAVLLVETGRTEHAFTMLKRWVMSSPQVADARIELARLYEEFGDREACRIHLNEAIARAPDNDRAWAALGRLREQMGDYTQALANYQHAHRLNSFRPGVANRIASLQQGVSGGFAAPGGTRIVNSPAPAYRY